MKKAKKLFLIVAVCLIMSLLCGLAACGPQEKPDEGIDTAPTDLKIDGATGDYSFTAVKGVSKYFYSIFKSKEFDKETGLPGFEATEKKDENNNPILDEQGNQTYDYTQYEPVYSGNVTKNSGKINYLSNIPFGKYVILFSNTSDYAKADLKWFAEFTHPGKLSTPTFGITSGVSRGGFGPGPGGNGPAAPGGEGPAPGGDAPAPIAEGEGPAPGDGGNGGQGGGFPGGGSGSGSGSTSLDGYKLQVNINTDKYLKNAFKNEGVFGYKVEVYILNEGVTLEEGKLPTMDQVTKIDEGHIDGAGIKEAAFTLYSGNDASWTELHLNGVGNAAVNLGEYFTANGDAKVTVYIRVQADGNAAEGAEASEWSDLKAYTMTASSSIPMDAGFGYPEGSHFGSF